MNTYESSHRFRSQVQLGVLALVAVYGAVLAGEFVAGGGQAARLLGSMGLPITAVRLLIHSLITLPVAYVVGYGLVRWAPFIGSKVVIVVALLWSTFIVVLQLSVYEPSVAGASVLKVLFVVVPLLLGKSMANRARQRNTGA